MSGFRVVVRLPRSPLDGEWLRGPLSPAHVRKHGYSFTSRPEEAWVFPTWRQARNKARILDAHMGWGDACFTQPATLPDGGAAE